MTAQDEVTDQNPLTRVIRNSTAAISFALFLSFGVSILLLVPPVYMINIFDKVIISQSLSTLVGMSLAALVGIGLYMVFDVIRSKVFIIVGGWISQRLNDELLEVALTQSLRGKASVGDTLKDIGDLKSFVSGTSIAAALELLWSPIFFLVLFLLHWSYLAIAMVAAVVLVGLAIVNEVVVRRATKAAKRSALHSYSDLGDALKNSEVIASMGLMDNILTRWRRANGETLEAAQKAELSESKMRAISRGIIFVDTMAIIGLGAYLVILGEITGGVLFAAMIISRHALQPFGSVVGSWREWVNARSVYSRLMDLIREDNRTRPRGRMALPRPEGALEVERLVFIPPGSPTAVLRGISFKAQPGEMVAIIGPSAAGKSTLAKMLLGIWAPSAGAVRLDGHDTYTWERANFGGYVGYLPQNIELFSGTVRENIGRLEDVSAESIIKAAKLAGVHEMVGRFQHGYDTDIGSFGKKLTGGQAQRIGLARALFNDPSLIVLDEPDASLDVEGQIALVDALQASKDRGATVIFVSHRPSLIKLVDKIIVLNEGSVERIVGPSDLRFDERGLIAVARSSGHARSENGGRQAKPALISSIEPNDDAENESGKSDTRREVS